MREIKFRIFDGDRMRFPTEINNFVHTIPTEETNPKYAEYGDAGYDEYSPNIIGIKYDIMNDEYIGGEFQGCSWVGVECRDKPHIKAIMQYTGLKDKNGAEIYEGDILSRAIKCDKCSQKEQRMIVGYSGDSFITTTCDYNGDHKYNYDEWEHFVVIGNIYKNPDLLCKL